MNLTIKPQISNVALDSEAKKYLNAERGVESVAEALALAADILAEQVADKADIRAYLREYIF